MTESDRNFPNNSKPSGSNKAEKITGTVPELLAQAQLSCSRGENERLQLILESLAPQYPFSSPEQSTLYDRLLLFAQIRAGRYLDAEQTVSRGLQSDSQSADLLYAQAFIKTTLREYEEAIDAAEKYLTAIELGGNENDGLATSDSHRAQLLNFLATALKETGRTDRAVERYEQAIKADPVNHLPYLNLAAMLASQNRMDDAEKVVQRGMRNCRQVNELRMVLSGYTSRTTVSACMIVKNEEDMLEDCLKSIRDWVDEIILVDTGSTDKTVAIAEQYCARIFHQPWEGDFSKARNYSLEQATSDWILIIDADERIVQEDVPQIRRFLNDPKNSLISINVLNVYGDNEEMTTFLPSERIFKRDLNLRYKGIVHNQLDVPDGLAALRTPIRLKHLGYGLAPDKMKQKLQRSRELLEKQLQEKPDNAFAHFNLAQLLRAGEKEFPVENAPDIIEHAVRGVELTSPDISNERHIHLMCLDQLAWTHFYTDRMDQAEEFCRRAIELKPDYLDPLVLLGHIAVRQHKFEDAIERYQKYISVQAEYDPSRELANIILFHVDSRASAYYSMAIAQLALDRKDHACGSLEKALRVSPAYLDANARLGRLYFDSGRLVEAEACFNQQLDLGEPSRDAALGLAAISLNRGNGPEAEQFFRSALRITPGDSVAALKLARYLVDSGKIAEATEVLEKGESEAGSTQLLRQELAAVYYKTERYDDAARILETLVQENPENPDLANDLGNCYFKLDQLEKADSCYQKSLETAPQLDIAYRNLGLTRIRLGRIKEAIWALERYVEINPAEIEIIQMVGDLYRQAGDFDTALDYYERILPSCPNNVGAMFALSECYLHMGHTDSAIMGYRRALSIDPNYEPAQERINSLAAPVGHS